MSLRALDLLPEWKDDRLEAGRTAVATFGRRQVLRGGLMVSVLTATMSVFDWFGTKIAARAGTDHCGSHTYASNCAGGATNSNNACDKGCVSEPQHSFYCYSTTYGSRHRQCGVAVERYSYDGEWYHSFTQRKGDCYNSSRQAWRWELPANTCGCSGGKVKKTSCADGFTYHKPASDLSGPWLGPITSVCRLHSACVTATGN